MSRAAYRVTLWRSRPRWRGGSVAVASQQIWVDLLDETEASELVATLITRCGGQETDIAQYWAELADIVTGDLVTRLSPSLDDLGAARNGGRERAPGSVLSLPDVSTEALVREVARRLRGR